MKILEKESIYPFGKFTKKGKINYERIRDVPGNKLWILFKMLWLELLGIFSRSFDKSIILFEIIT